MDKVQKPSESVCYTPSSKPVKICIGGHGKLKKTTKRPSTARHRGVESRVIKSKFSEFMAIIFLKLSSFR
jgi:hypothetical protein